MSEDFPALTVAFFAACAIVEVWTLWKALDAPEGKEWPWFTAFLVDCAAGIVVGTWLLTS